MLGVAADNSHRTILLGAWGCGVFRNDPALVADAFGTWLESPAYTGVFDRVVFAIYDTGKNAAYTYGVQAAVYSLHLTGAAKHLHWLTLCIGNGASTIVSEYRGYAWRRLLVLSKP